MKKTLLIISFTVILCCLFAFSCFAYGSLSDNPLPPGKTVGFYSESFSSPFPQLPSIGVTSYYTAYTDGTELIILYVFDSELFLEFCSTAPTDRPFYSNDSLQFADFYEMALNSTSIYSNFGDFNTVADTLVTSSSALNLIHDLNAQVLSLQTQLEQSVQNNASLTQQNQNLQNRVDSLMENAPNNYLNGYNQGLADADALNTGLKTMFSAPFNTFGEIFNFEILGFNIFTLIQVLFTILICSFFIRIFI